MKRLLNENEITLIVGWPSAFEYARIVELNKSQLAKTDKEWVEWVVIEAAVIRLGDEQNELANGDYIIIPAQRWQQRRKEIGI